MSESGWDRAEYDEKVVGLVRKLSKYGQFLSFTNLTIINSLYPNPSIDHFHPHQVSDIIALIRYLGPVM